MIQIQNEQIVLQIAEHGAEIKSLTKGGKEYLWKADPAYWGRTAPVLFPFVGSLKNKEYRIGNQVYPMGQHGFARDMDFFLKVKGTDFAVFSLKSSEETRAKYPYDFELEIGYRLLADSVKVTWKVINTGESELPFSLGGHPAFNCGTEGYSLHLYSGEIQTLDAGVGCHDSEKEPVSGFTYHKLTGEGTVRNEINHMDTPQGKLPISQELFAEDALIIEDSKINRVTIADETGMEYLQVDFEAPLFGLWSPAGKNAPFVCIEPWYGRADAEDFSGELEERAYGNLLEAGGIFERSFMITILS